MVTRGLPVGSGDPAHIPTMLSRESSSRRVVATVDNLTDLTQKTVDISREFREHRGKPKIIILWSDQTKVR